MEIVKNGSISIRIYRIAAPKTLDGHAFRFRERIGEQVVRGNSVNLDAIKIEAKRVAKLLSQGITEHVKATDISELLALRQLASELGAPPLAAMQEWAAAKALAGPALLTIAKEHADAVADGRHTRVTHAEAWDRFIAAMDHLGRKGTRTYKSKAKMIQKGLPGGLMLDTLTKKTITAWANKVEHPGTRNELVKRLGTMLRWAQGNDLFPVDRAIPSDGIDRAFEPYSPPGIVTPLQLKSCLEWVRRNHPQYLAALALGSLGGMRSDEIHGKRSDKGKPRADMPRQLWAHIYIKPKADDGACGYFHVSIAKAGTPECRKTPIPAALAAWLALCPRDVDGGNVCIAGAMERVRELLRKADTDLGFPKVQVEIDGEKVSVNDLPDNAFRHAWISHRIPFVGIVQAAAEAGNSPGEIERSYRVPMDIEEARPYWQVMPD